MGETRFIKTKKERNYTTLDNTFIKDTSLSWKAKGLMTYFLSLPDDWVIHFSEVEKHSTDGKGVLRSAINELKEHGYLKAEQKKENGRFAGMVYTIIENPSKSSPQTDLPLTENPPTEKPLAENQTLLNTNKYKVLKEQNTNNIVIGGDPQTTKTTEKNRFTKPSVEEIRAYCEERKNEIDAEYFFDYYESKGWMIGKNRMKDWKACVRTWERKNKQQAPQHQTDWTGQATDEEYLKGSSDLDKVAF